MSLPRRDALETALEFLRRRERSRAEIEARLAQLAYPPEEIESVVERLERYGYLDEKGMAQRIAERRRRQLFGEMAVEAELRSKSIEAEPKPADELPRALALLRKRFPDADPTHLPRAARLLASRGFDEDTLEGALSQHFPDVDSYLHPD